MLHRYVIIIVCKLLGTGFFQPCKIIWINIQIILYIKELIFFLLLRSTIWYGCICLAINLLKDILIISSFRLLEHEQLCIVFVWHVCVWACIFSEMNAQQWNCYHVVVAYIVLKKLPNCFLRVSYQCMSDLVSPYPCLYLSTSF